MRERDDSGQSLLGNVYVGGSRQFTSWLLCTRSLDVSARKMSGESIKEGIEEAPSQHADAELCAFCCRVFVVVYSFVAALAGSEEIPHQLWGR